MEPTPAPKKRIHIFPALLSLTILSGLFWLIGLNIDIYGNAFIGAVFEMLWLPAVLASFVVPIACLVLWFMAKLSLKSTYFYLLLASVAITGMVVWSNG